MPRHPGQDRRSPLPCPSPLCSSTRCATPSPKTSTRPSPGVREIGYENVEPYAFVERAADLREGLRRHGPHGPVRPRRRDRRRGQRPDLGRRRAPRHPDSHRPVHPDRPLADRRRLVAKIAERVNVLTAEAASRGLKFGYHNHQWEFTNKVDGKSVYEHFVSQLAPETVLEVDTFWATRRRRGRPGRAPLARGPRRRDPRQGQGRR